MIAPEWFRLLTETSFASWLFALLMLGGVLYWAITGVLFSRWLARKPSAMPEELPPVVFFRPVKRGVPELEEKAWALLRAARPGDRVVFGVGSVEDEAICLAACREQTPAGVESQVFFCPPPASLPVNPKIWKVKAMCEGLASGPMPDHWIISDAEALPDRSFFDRFRAEWAASGHAAFTACYRFTSPSSWVELLDRLPLLLTLWPGVMAAEAGGGKRGLGFALGACMAVHRRDLEKIGGWERLLSLLAEDNRLGAFLRDAGVTTGLSREIMTLEGDSLGWREWLRHQHRMAMTYRVCHRWGTLGMVLTHGVTGAFLLAALHPGSLTAWAVAGAVVSLRIAHTRGMSRSLRLLHDLPLWRFSAGVVLASLIESLCWIAAWLPLPVCWNQRALKVDRQGRLLAAPAVVESREEAVEA